MIIGFCDVHFRKILMSMGKSGGEGRLAAGDSNSLLDAGQ